MIAKSVKRQRHNTRHGKSSKAGCDRDKNWSEDPYANPQPSTSKQAYSDDTPNNSKQKSNKSSLDKFSTTKDDDKLPLAYRPDRYNNDQNNDDDSDSVSTNINKSLVELSDVDSDIAFSDDNVGRPLVIDSDVD